MAETVVAGMIVGEFIADFCERSENAANIPTRLVEETLRREQARIDVLIDGRGTESATALMAEMQNIMTAKVGIFRTGRVLEEAVTNCNNCYRAAATSVCAPRPAPPIPNWLQLIGYRRCSKWRCVSPMAR